jgi:S1-C subfamily serine protease
MNSRFVALCFIALSLGASAAMAQDVDRDAELAQARQQLEDAARRIAELTTGSAGVAHDFAHRAGGRPPRAVLGVGIEDDEQGVRVVGVTPGGGADEAGVETGDVITAMDGATLGGENGSPSEVLIAQMGNVDPGDTVTLSVLRDGDTLDLEVEATAPRWQNFLGAAPGMGPGDMTGPRGRPLDFPGPMHRWADMELVELTPGLGAYFGTEEGVLVIRAPRDDTLGLQDGDVILEIGGRAPRDVRHALRILASFAPGEQLELAIMRDQGRRTLEIDFPADTD